MTKFLPQYQFEKLAAYGGMGAVFKARQESLDRPVAIKVLPPDFGKEKEFADRFKSEARAMAKLNHTHIVAVYDFGITQGGHLYLVMEWVEGGTLHEIIHKGVLPLRRAADMAMQLCEALTYAHENGILHRDIKPGNIMINKSDQVKVADFGLARAITGEAEENPYGTPDYAAPEILGGGAVDQRVDIFAAGVVLYEMLTGKVPQKPRRSVTDFAPVSPRWDTLIDLATHPDPAKRFQSALEFRAHIRQALAGGATAVAAAVVVEEPAQKSKKRLTPLHFGLIGAGAVALLALILSMLFQPDEKKKERGKEPAQRVVKKSAEEPEERPKKNKAKDEKPEKQPKVTVMVPAPEPEPQKVTPAPAPPQEKMPPVVSTPALAVEDPRLAIQNLEERDPELAQLVKAFGAEWSANAAIDTEGEIQELADKYIPALQRSLAGLSLEQRDPILSEISHVANREPLNEPDAAWPPALQNLRQAYKSQLGAIQEPAVAAAQTMRAAQCELILAKAKERAAAGKTEAAKRAEIVAAELARLKGAPSVRALKQGVAGEVVSDAPPAVNTGAP